MDKEIQVFYDGSCPLCSKEISLYKNTQCTNPVKWVDVSNNETELDNQSREKLMSRFHIKDSDGNMLSGAKAFVHLWSNMRGWKYLAKVSNNPVVLPIAEFMYNKFLVVRPKIKSFIENCETDIPNHLVRDLRSDYAGEVGAVQIYKGILFATKDKELVEFAKHHLETENKHLEMVSSYLPKYRRTILKPFWIVAGFLTGYLPAIVSKNATYRTIEAVETFVDHHYQEQIVDILPALKDGDSSCEMRMPAHENV